MNEPKSYLAVPFEILWGRMDTKNKNLTGGISKLNMVNGLCNWLLRGTVFVCRTDPFVALFWLLFFLWVHSNNKKSDHSNITSVHQVTERVMNYMQYFAQIPSIEEYGWRRKLYFLPGCERVSKCPFCSPSICQSTALSKFKKLWYTAVCIYLYTNNIDAVHNLAIMFGIYSSAYNI